MSYDYVGPPDPPPERFQLLGNQAYREILPRCQYDAPPLPSNCTEGSGGSEGSESSRQTSEMVQLKDNVAYEQTEIQWNLRREDTLGTALLSSLRRLSSSRRLFNICLVSPPPLNILCDMVVHYIHELGEVSV